MTPFKKPYYRSSFDGDEPLCEGKSGAQFTLYAFQDLPTPGDLLFLITAPDGSWVECNTAHDLASSVLQFFRFKTLRPWQSREEIEPLRAKWQETRTAAADPALSGLSLEDLL